MSSQLKNNTIKQIAEEYTNRIWNNKDFSVIDNLVDNEIIIHSVLGDFHGPKTLKEVVNVWLKAFPDLKVINTLVIAENDIVSIQWQARGTHKGEFKGKSPTGKIITYTGVTLYRIQNGKIIEYWVYIDMQHLLNQL
ncbi:MAG: ester cyclase [Parachlamydiaceae bacterium]|nr:ester cyclase [Parachlamydiaceae bacterium]